uniref:AtUGT85A4 (UDP-glucosyl transferase 85A4) n=1 Tax=Arundo donax TaxID=35708 RepID=A0A0A8YP96_ARUDO
MVSNRSPSAPASKAPGPRARRRRPWL